MLAEIPRCPLTSGHLQKMSCTKHEKVAVPRQAGSRRTRPQKSCYFGVEVSEELVWDTWELGREITKTLQLKNVHIKMQKLRFKSPSSKFFTTLFPQTIVLSPGTSFSLPVTFRSLEKRENSDAIEFECKEGVFRVLLRATLPRHMLEMPESVLVPACAAFDSSRVIFFFRNASKLVTSFSWVVPEPFQFTPVSGTLEPGAQCEVTVLFTTQAALVYEGIATCTFGDGGELSTSLRIQALSKYPHLLVSVPGHPSQMSGQEDTQSVLDFGAVAVGDAVEKHFEIHNLSSVRAPFRVAQAPRPSLLEDVFFCEAQQGSVPGGSTLTLPVRFSPKTVGSTSVDYFYITSAGNVCKAVVKVTGSCKGPLVSLSSSVVDFGLVELGEFAVRTLQIANTSDVPAHYQFSIDCSYSVFSVDKPWGVLAGESSLTLRLCFQPSHPISHYRRVACFIHHQKPIFLDLIGTCHSEQLKPAILKPKHLRLYSIRERRGLTIYPPDILSAMVAEKKLLLDENGALFLPLQESDGDPAEPPPVSDPVGEDLKEGWGDDVLRFRHVTLDPPEILFHNGPCSRPLSLTNHTKGRLTIIWTSLVGSPFSVTPLTCDLPPLKTSAFRINYSPGQDNTFHGAELECFAFYTVVKDHQYMEDSTMCPPWCGTLRVSGHSFQPGHQHFIPRYTLQQPTLVFPTLNQQACKSILFQNNGELPITFSLDPNNLSVVKLHPTSGLVQPGTHQIFTLRKTPAEENGQKHILSLQLNASQNHIQEITVISVAEKPRISLEGDGTLFFKPTAVGLSSERSYLIKNVSCVPLTFEWRIWSPDSQVLSVLPKEGILQPNESLAQTWSFTPLAETQYCLKPCLVFCPLRTQSSISSIKKTRLSLRVMGLAAQGTIEAESPVVDLGPVLVGSCQMCDLVLLNHGSCPLRFSLTIEQGFTGPCLPEELQNDPIALDLECCNGTIPARSKVIVKATAKPARRVPYSWSITYEILTSTGQVIAGAQSLCQVNAQGVYPMLTVSDARSSGSVEGISKLQLWNLFSLETLNSYLQRDPTPTELTYRVPTRHSLRRCPSVFTPVLLDFNFSAAPLGSEPSSVLLMFENKGTIPVEWSFLFPADQQIELEYWAESGEFDATELHEMRVQDNKLFGISPRSGSLLPGQQRAVQLTYRHEFAGTDHLPVLLKVSHGREILLNFIGVTLEKDRRYIHFTSSKHTFAPVAIGSFSPPKQIYELYNGGSVPLSYHIDMEPLEDLKEENFGHPILQCLNPTGEVQPGRTAFVEWVFSPLEARTYSVDVPIHILEGDSALVSFEGAGYDARALGEAAPLSDGTPSSLSSTQKVPLPGQLVFLSEERISFGDIPVCSKNTRMVFLYNTSETERVFYTWHSCIHNAGQVVQMHPESGELAAGESSHCVITLCASGSPSFCVQDLICQVTTGGALTQYRSELQQWELEKERQKNEFTVMDRDTKPSTQPKGSAGLELKMDSKVRKYKNLPPIQSKGSGLGRSEHRTQREAADVWRRPDPPRPFLLHLLVTACSHSLLEFQSNFPSLQHKHYIQRSMKPIPAPLTHSDEPDRMAGISLTPGPEREIITDILTSLIRSLLDDPQFHQSLLNSLTEPVPYFSQLKSPQSSRLPSRQDQAEEGAGSALSSPTPQTPVRRDLSSTVLGEPGPWEADPQGFQPQEQQPEVREAIKRLPEFCDLTEEILLNTLQNIIMEACVGEVVLTARPRVIALPPSSIRRSSQSSSSRQQSHAQPNSSAAMGQRDVEPNPREDRRTPGQNLLATLQQNL
ncbi:cilia- and flagella-associated protein 65 isoform X2 [Amia ocellicauda]|uniref:cilia- and flagella-associated protein 65 isoform X2 n=1 Tax=Amia ocellicauda TaxID=2972642 RepID=UPI003464AC76